MKVLLTGSEGFLGSMLGPHLRRCGHDVTGYDTGYYRTGVLYHDREDVIPVRVGDVRELAAADLEGFDAIVHLAELSNDPLGQLAPTSTEAINHRGTSGLARAARDAGVTRFVQMSSCSVYGIADGFVDESSAVDPRTVYAQCKVQVEEALHGLAGDDFSPTMLRNATAFGASPHMRFDLVLNNLAGLAWTTGRIAMTSDGSPWRPLVHGRDIAGTVAAVLAAPREVVHDEVFNVGHDDHNYRVRDIAEHIRNVFTGCELSFGPPSGDDRSYRVSFAKLRSTFPALRFEWDARRGAEELHELFARIGFDQPMFELRPFTRLHQLEHLLESGQIDGDLRWTS